MRFVPIFAWTLATVAANPVPEAGLEERQATCNANNIAFRVLANLGARGSSFCNDLLNLPTETTSTELPVRTITVTVPSSTRTLPFPFLCPTARAKREAEESLDKRQLPGLGNFAAGQITAGCSCLDLDPRTFTSTITPPADLTTITRGVKTTCLPRVG